MSNVALEVTSLGKRYQIGGPEEPYGTIRGTLSRIVKSPWSRFSSGARQDRVARTIWALRDVSFQVKHGRVLGIVGHNGAGKSTLLKILSRITEPTEGRATVFGRVGSLLEVGTGFHPELTGRENVFLNGAILGMSRTDIIRRFDEIVDFAGVGQYLDTAVKYYSSGMYMRLAFAVSAHLEPDVLVVDEVLAVGDAEFQKKCLGKMSSVAGEGRTVLFVSHNFASVEALCDEVLVLASGQTRCIAPTSEALNVYRGMAPEPAAVWDLTYAAERRHGMHNVLKRLQFRDRNGVPTNRVKCGEPLTIEIEYESKFPLSGAAFAVLIDSIHGTPVCHLPSQVTGGIPSTAPAHGIATCAIDSVNLAPALYKLRLGCISNGTQIDLIEAGSVFEVEPGDFYGTGKLPDAVNGPTLLRAGWTLTSLPTTPQTTE